MKRKFIDVLYSCKRCERKVSFVHDMVKGDKGFKEINQMTKKQLCSVCLIIKKGN